MKKKWLGITLALLVVVVAAVAAVVTFGDTKADAADQITATTISASKDKYLLGEEIVISYDKLPKDVFWDHQNANSELLIFKESVYSKYGDKISGSMMYAELGPGNGSNGFKASDYEGGYAPAGSFTFPNDRDGGSATTLSAFTPGTYTVVAAYQPTDSATVYAASNIVRFEVVGTEISTSKSQYLVGEKIVVNYGELPKSVFWDQTNGDSELLIFKESVYSKYGDTISGSMMYAELGAGNGSNGFKASDYEGGYAPAGSFTFPDDRDGGGATSLSQFTPGTYTVIVSYRVSDESVVRPASNIVRFEIVEPADQPVTISIEGGNTTIAQGESFTINWTGLPEYMRGDTEAEIRFYKDGTYINGFKGTMPEGCTGGSSTAYIDLCVGAGNADIWSESGSKTFPDDSNKNAGFILPEGKYRVVLTSSRCVEESNVLEINVFVPAPVVTIDQPVYVYGEEINISWSGLTDYWRTANIEMRIDEGYDLPEDIGISEFCQI